jgi:hypothetical protein
VPLRLAPHMSAKARDPVDRFFATGIRGIAATPREKGSDDAALRHLRSGFWPARRFADLGVLDKQYSGWRDRICNVRCTRPTASGSPSGCRGVAGAAAAAVDSFRRVGQRAARVPLDGYLPLPLLSAEWVSRLE